MASPPSGPVARLPGVTPGARPAVASGLARGLAGGAALGVALACSLVSGCFYLEPVNQRPGIEIIRLAPEALSRGGTVSLQARVLDPEGGAVSLLWRAHACGQTVAECDADSFDTRAQAVFEVAIPTVTLASAPVQHLKITLEATDERGASARPSQELYLDIGNEAPVLTSPRATGALVVGQPVEVLVVRSDADDAASNVALTWTLFPPVGGKASLGPLAYPGDSDHEQRRQFTPDVEGPWSIEVVARDPLAREARVVGLFAVEVDRPPCLRALAPQPPAAPATLLLDSLRRFSVLTVQDTLDPFPGGARPPFGVAQFTWSLKAPSRGGARQVLPGAAGNFVELDPAGFELGELVELRVEIADRVARSLPCADGAATCSIEGTGCLQRQTWLLEAR